MFETQLDQLNFFFYIIYAALFVGFIHVCQVIYVHIKYQDTLFNPAWVSDKLCEVYEEGLKQIQDSYKEKE